ncbi:DUF4236 domain-containing protein [Microbacterium betulae]|uniref:DUF4236 domain-containing protein n=1 Tax=Microbacterium betulae TaxID=2981139 RepID=A0AA97I5L2_9MICO|nr:DUF4236 domain-containing protein [Microbacterium sp. AB]WOF23866.1 DUF4236 domain-containing protein [Microbacterium sp. AB]
MGFFFHKSKKLGKTTRLNLSGSGASVSKRVGPFTISSRGYFGVRLGKGIGFRKKLW